MMSAFLKRLGNILRNPVAQNWAAIAVAAALLILATIFYLVPLIITAQSDAIGRQSAIAMQSRDLLSLYLKLTENDLAQFGDELSSARGGYAVQSASDAFFREHANFLTFVLTDATGTALYSGSRDGAVSIAPTGVSDAGASFFQQALAGTEYVSPVYFGPTGPILRISEPIYDSVSGSVVGVVAAEIDLSGVFNTVKMPNVDGGKVYVVDSTGTIIADPDPVRSGSGENLRYRAIVDRVLSGQGEVDGVPYTNERNAAVIGTAVSMPETGWGVIVEQSSAAVKNGRQAAAGIAIAFSAATVLLIIVLVIGTVRLTRALSVLSRDRSEIETEKNKTELVLSGVTDAVIAVDLARNIIALNPVAEKLTGYKRAQVIGKPIGTIMKLFEGLREVPVSEYCPITPGKEVHEAFSRKALRLTTSGKESFIDIIAGEVEGGERGNVGCIMTLHDVTKEHLFERLKQDFVTVAAHQLRTPLSAIKWTFNMVLDGDLGTITPDQRAYLMRGFESTNRLIALVNDMLDVDRLESGMTKFALVPSVLSNILESAIIDANPQATKKTVTLAFADRPGKDESKVNMDADKIRTVFTNLIDNAIKYTPKGGSVTVRLAREGNFMVASIADSGIGIPTDQQSEVFRRFFRARNAVKQETDGSGLGLYLARNIIERHGGRMWFESAEDKGTTFRVALPVWVG